MTTNCYYIKQGYKFTAWFCCNEHPLSKLTSVIGMSFNNLLNKNSTVYRTSETPELNLIALEMLLKLRLNTMNFELYKADIIDFKTESENFQG